MEADRHQTDRLLAWAEPLDADRVWVVITNEVQCRVTTAHLERFEQAAAQHRGPRRQENKLDRLELYAVRA